MADDIDGLAEVYAEREENARKSPVDDSAEIVGSKLAVSRCTREVVQGARAEVP
jgi:hypothetical protein